MSLEFICSQRGGKILIDEGYLLTKHRHNKRSITWRCKRHRDGCTARVFTTNDTPTGKLV